ncbi:MAG: STAS domain-containing protein [Planctomycetota bacterium]|jgi:anti-sigma B factor antagonist
MTRTSPTIDVTETSGAHVIKFSRRGVLDPTCLHEVREYISGLLKKEEGINVVLDLEEVELISSEAIGLIVALDNAIRPRSGKLHLANVSDATYSVFEVAQLHDLMEIFDSTQEAIEAFG